MKELSIEQKAKRYDEVLAMAKECVTYVPDNAVNKYMFNMFPELKESEDEKIRKALIEYFNEQCDMSDWNGVYGYQVVAWLEKQDPKKQLEAAPCRDIEELTAQEPTEGMWPYTDPADTLDGEIDNMWNKLSMNGKFTALKSGFREVIHHFANWLQKQGHTDGIIETAGKLIALAECLEMDGDCLFNGLSGNDYGKFLRELAKKIEQKSADKIEPKFHEGDWVVLTAGELSTTLQIVKVDINKRLYWFNDNSYLPIVDEECLHLWTIQDAKDGDVLATLWSGAFIYNGKRGGLGCPGSYCGINTLGRFQTGSETHWTTGEAYPATKEQRDLLFQKMKESGWEWDAEKKELKKIEDSVEKAIRKDGYEWSEDTHQLKKIEQKPLQWNISDYRTWQYIVSDVLTKHDGIGQYLDDGFCKKIAKYMQETWSNKLSFGQNPAWSEEDERLLSKLQIYVDMECFDRECNGKDLLDWLKSLKERHTWKPSDEQIKTLLDAIVYVEGCNSNFKGNGSVLENLYNDLKKLKQ